jgi:hypothetical protein
MARRKNKTLLHTELTLRPYESVQWQIELKKGAPVRGVVEEKNSNWLRVYLMDESNYVKKKNGTAFTYWGAEHKGAVHLDLNVPKAGVYHLLIEHDDWWGQVEHVRVDLRSS